MTRPMIQVNNELREMTDVEFAEMEFRVANAAPNIYRQNRQSEYPPFTDYLDGIVKGDHVQVQAYIDACLAVKAKYPKG